MEPQPPRSQASQAQAVREANQSIHGSILPVISSTCWQLGIRSTVGRLFPRLLKGAIASEPGAGCANHGGLFLEPACLW